MSPDVTVAELVDEAIDAASRALGRHTTAPAGTVGPTAFGLLVAALGSDRRGWTRQAACRGHDPALFFPGRGGSRQVAQARAICAGCCVRTECLAEAIGDSSTAGVWGGLAELERRALRVESQSVAS